MKISEVLKSEKVTVSMEVFPPKTDANFETVEKAVDGIIELSPSFISCTYGAGGGFSTVTLEVTPREAEILQLLAKGYLYKEIAEKLSIGNETVRTHVRHIYDKLHVRTRTEAVIKHLKGNR